VSAGLTGETGAITETESPETDGHAAEPVAVRPADGQTGTAPPVGFVGLGATGLPMAVNIARRFPLLGCDTDAARLSLLVDEVGPQGTVHTTPMAAEVAARCDVIVLMLPTTRDVVSVIGALGDALRIGTLVIDMGTADPRATRRLAAGLSDRSVHLIDAPACGSVADARAGRLTILAGGAEIVIAQAMPYLRLLGEPIIRTGAIGSGHAMAALKGFVEAAGLLAVAEAKRIGEAAGLDPNLVADVLGPGGGGLAPSGQVRVGPIAAELEIASAIADDTATEGASLAATLGMWRQALERLGPEADSTGIGRMGQPPAAPSGP